MYFKLLFVFVFLINRLKYNNYIHTYIHIYTYQPKIATAHIIIYIRHYNNTYTHIHNIKSIFLLLLNILLVILIVFFYLNLVEDEEN